MNQGSKIRIVLWAIVDKIIADLKTRIPIIEVMINLNILEVDIADFVETAEIAEIADFVETVETADFVEIAGFVMITVIEAIAVTVAEAGKIKVTMTTKATEINSKVILNGTSPYTLKERRKIRVYRQRILPQSEN